MGNVADSKPQKYTSDMRGRPYVYSGGYMATYKQDNPNADTVQYGNNKMQFGVKMVQDTSGPREGDLYVTDPNGKRLYFTKGGVVNPNAGFIIKKRSWLWKWPRGNDYWLSPTAAVSYVLLERC